MTQCYGILLEEDSEDGGDEPRVLHWSSRILSPGSDEPHVLPWSSRILSPSVYDVRGIPDCQYAWPYRDMYTMHRVHGGRENVTCLACLARREPP